MTCPAADEKKSCRKLQFLDSMTYTISSTRHSKLDQLQGCVDKEEPPQIVIHSPMNSRQPAITTERPAAQVSVLGEPHRSVEPVISMEKPPTAAPPSDTAGHYAKNIATSDNGGVTSTSSWSSSVTETFTSTSTLSSESTSSFESTSSHPTKNENLAMLQYCILRGIGESLDQIIEPALSTSDAATRQEEPRGHPSSEWVPVLGAVVLTTLLVSLAATAADRSNQIVLASAVTEPVEMTPHLVFPIDGVGAGLVVTDPVQMIGKAGEPIGSDGFDMNTGGVARTGIDARDVSLTSTRMFNVTARSGRAHTTSSATSPGHAIVGDVSGEDGAGTEALKDILAFPFRLPRSCSGALYTTCNKARREYRYSRSLSACVEAGAKDATAMFLVCNRSPNRFSSVEVCERRCVLSERPEDECLEQPLFTACARQDVKSVWWFFDGKSCKRWGFAKGGCPENNGALAIFSSEGECTRRCTNPRYPPCLRPSLAPCDSKILKFPAFAYVSAGDGRIHCLTTLVSKPRVFRCLEGSNRYHSKQACERACRGNVPANITTPNGIWRRNGS